MRGPINNVTDTIDRLWNRYCLKRRHILAISSTDYSKSRPQHDFPYRLLSFTSTKGTDLPSRTYSELCSIVGFDRVTERFANPHITLFAALTEKDELAGFRWALHPVGNPVWHDFLRVPPTDTLIFNSYTAPSHRRRGIFSALINYGNGHLFSSLGTNRILAIVETQNIASRDALLGQGLKAIGTNFLVKLAGVNVITVTKFHSAPPTIDYAFRNAKSARY